ncbi:MAG: hypothetical protein IH795_12390 [Bacteroidetes bacterium]|nr:hypothetical protein [Bacteroidota bacterium]
MSKDQQSKQKLTDIEKQAITMWQLIHKTVRKYNHSIPQTSIRTIKKATKNFLKNAKNTKYNKKCVH